MEPPSWNMIMPKSMSPESDNSFVLNSNAFFLQSNASTLPVNHARLVEADMVKFYEAMLDANPEWLTANPARIAGHVEAPPANSAGPESDNRFLAPATMTLQAHQDLLIAIAAKLDIAT
jgi:hypothetical protein